MGASCICCLTFICVDCNVNDNLLTVKTHYYRAPFNFTHIAYITGADIRSK